MSDCGRESNRGIGCFDIIVIAIAIIGIFGFFGYMWFIQNFR